MSQFGEQRNETPDATRTSLTGPSTAIPENAIHFLQEVQAQFAAQFIQQVAEHPDACALDYPEFARQAMNTVSGLKGSSAKQTLLPSEVNRTVEIPADSVSPTFLERLREYLTNPIP